MIIYGKIKYDQSFCSEAGLRVKITTGGLFQLEHHKPDLYQNAFFKAPNSL